MSDRRDRIIPYITTFLFFAFTQHLIRSFPVNYFIATFLFSCTIAVLMVTAITLFWKISTHMVGIGGLTGLVIALSVEFRADLMTYLMLLILISGLLGTVRMISGDHKPLQVFLGFLLGILTVSGLIWQMY